MESFCSACGSNLAAGDQFCRVCGRPTTGAAIAPDGQLPLNPAIPAETSGKAVASLVCGLLFFVPLAFLAAIIFGHIALSEIHKSAGRLKGAGMAIAGLILGYLWVVAFPIMLIIAAIAIPNLLRARMAANESSAVFGIRRLAAAEVSYAANHPQTGFTCSLSDLSSEKLISNRLGIGEQAGYAFELKNCSAEPVGSPNTKFEIVAYPLRAHQTGVRAFCADESAVIKVDDSGSPSRCIENGEPLH
jgi:type IV pilus assembly protein PilA